MRFRRVLAFGLGSLTAGAACADDMSAHVLTLVRGDIVATLEGERQELAPVSLPLHWDSSFARRNGRAIVSIDFPRPPGSAGATDPYAIFALRLGNAFTISLNGTRLASYGDLDAHYAARAFKQPLRVMFPAAMLSDQNRLVVELRGDYARRAGLSTILLGPASLLDPVYLRAYTHRVVIPIACSVLSLLVSAFCLLLWLQQREPLYVWAFVGEAIWSLVILDSIWSISPLRWQSWTLIALVLRVIWIWSLYLVLEQVCGPHPRRERRTMKILNFSGPPLLLLGAAIHSAIPYGVWRAMLSILFVLALVRMSLSRSRRSVSEQFLMLSAVVVLIAAGVHDTFAEGWIPTIFADAEWAKYAGSLLALTIMWIVSRRFRDARHQHLELEASLAERVAARERELRDSYARVSELERSRAVTAERTRILRDMHDGVGTNLATAMRQLENGGAPATEVAATLRESLDHLKLSIDAMSLPRGDVNALLASLRYRLQPRIESAGLALEWDVDLLPLWPDGTDQAMRHLQFLLLEAISNTLQHAGARALTLTARSHGNSIAIALRDDGRGIATEPGRGFNSMRERAAAIGARLTVEPAAPGTMVHVVLPDPSSGTA